MCIRIKVNLRYIIRSKHIKAVYTNKVKQQSCKAK